MSRKKLHSAKSFHAVVRLPGDKSISHRYAILASLAEGRSEVFNFSPAADCHSTVECLRALGVKIEESEKGIVVHGTGLDGWKAPRRTLDAGNSGTTMRLMAGALAGQASRSSITGDASLRKRPMKRVIDPLQAMGAQIRAKNEQFAPLEIQGGNLRGIDYSPKVASAQVKSAILLAGLFAHGETTVHEPVRTRDHTEIALRELGAQLESGDGAVKLRGRPRLTGRTLVVPGDLSAAVFFIAAALIVPDSEVILQGVGLNPTRSAVLDFLVSIGAKLSVESVAMREGELIGDINVRYATLKGGKISGAMVARMIDELPMLAVLGAFTEEGIEIRDAQELRVKESDRIAAVAENLRGMGAEVEEFPDGLRVAGSRNGRLRGNTIDPHDDHRIAMAFSVAALGADGETAIRNPDCVGISFPGFYTLLDELVKPEA